MNLYAYCQGNPIRYTDPSGHTVSLLWNNSNGSQRYLFVSSDMSADVHTKSGFGPGDTYTTLSREVYNKETGKMKTLDYIEYNGKKAYTFDEACKLERQATVDTAFDIGSQFLAVGSRATEAGAIIGNAALGWDVSSFLVNVGIHKDNLVDSGKSLIGHGLSWLFEKGSSRLGASDKLSTKIGTGAGWIPSLWKKIIIKNKRSNSDDEKN